MAASLLQHTRAQTQVIDNLWESSFHRTQGRWVADSRRKEVRAEHGQCKRRCCTCRQGSLPAGRVADDEKPHITTAVPLTLWHS